MATVFLALAPAAAFSSATIDLVWMALAETLPLSAYRVRIETAKSPAIEVAGSLPQVAVLSNSGCGQEPGTAAAFIADGKLAMEITSPLGAAGCATIDVSFVFDFALADGGSPDASVRFELKEERLSLPAKARKEISGKISWTPAKIPERLLSMPESGGDGAFWASFPSTFLHEGVTASVNFSFDASQVDEAQPLHAVYHLRAVGLTESPALGEEEMWLTAVRLAARAVVGVELGGRLLGIRLPPPSIEFQGISPAPVHVAGAVAESRVRGEEVEVSEWELIRMGEGADVAKAEAEAYAVLDANWGAVEAIARRLRDRGAIGHVDVMKIIENAPTVAE